MSSEDRVKSSIFKEILANLLIRQQSFDNSYFKLL